MNQRLLLLCSVLALAACGDSEPKTEATMASQTIIFCGALIDGISNAPTIDQTISIVDSRIVSIAEGKPASGDFLDLSAYTCLPGLIDTHTHIMDNADDTVDMRIYYDRTPAEELEIAKKNSAATLAAGFTTIRNLGAYGGWGGREARNAVNRGDFPGPRIQTAGFYLTIAGGGGDLVIPGYPEENIPARIRLGVASGADEFREKAQAAVDGGADVLKVLASGAVLAFGGVPGAPEMTEEELRAVVEVGHAAGIKVTAHAHGAQSIKDAIRAGVDSIEHASLADDEAIALAAEHNVAFSMDVYNGSYIATVGRDQGWPEEFLRKNDETTEAQRQAFTKAHAAGVPIIFGTDAAVYPHGDNAMMFPIMVERGMTTMEAIQAATSVAADFIGWADDVGALVEGRYGDLIAVKGDPLENVGILQNVDVVVKGGERYK